MNSKINNWANTRHSEHYSVNSVHDEEPNVNPNPHVNFVTRQDLDALTTSITAWFQKSIQQAGRPLQNLQQILQQNIKQTVQRQTNAIPSFNVQYNQQQDKISGRRYCGQLRKKPKIRDMLMKKCPNN